MIFIRGIRSASLLALAAATASVTLGAKPAEADCCLYPAVVEQAPTKRNCCTLIIGPGGEKYFEATVKDVSADKGEVVLEGEAMHQKVKAFRVDPKPKAGDFFRGTRIKAILQDERTMEFRYGPSEK